MCDYVRQVEEFFLSLTATGAALPEGDVALILKWHAEGVPIELVKNTLTNEVIRKQKETGDQAPNRLKFYSHAVEKAFKQWLASSEAGFVEHQTPERAQEPDLVTEMLKKLEKLPQQFRGPAITAVKAVDLPDPQQLNTALLGALLDMMDENTRARIETVAKQAEQRGLATGLGRQAARNLGLEAMKRHLMEVMGVDELFV